MEPGVYQQLFELERDHWWFLGMRETCRAALLQHVKLANPRQVRCLDIGCGTGLWTKELEAFGEVYGLDVAPEALQFCRQRGLRKLVHASAEQLPLVAGGCDLITAIAVIEHLDDDAAFVAQLAHACRPGGYVLLLTSAYQQLWSAHDEAAHHKRRYTKTQLAGLLRCEEFEIVKLSYVNIVLLPAIVGFRVLK